MKQWNVTLGVRWLSDGDTHKKGEFRTTSHHLARDKWHTIGRGRETILIDEKGEYWKMHVNFRNEGDDFVIDFDIIKSKPRIQKPSK